MPKTKISEWSSTPSSNTDIDGINIAEGCAPSGINDAIREMMSQVKDLYSGTTGDAIAVAGGGTGGTTAAAALTNLGAQASLVSGTNIKTVNGSSLLGSGDLAVTAADLSITTAKLADSAVTTAKIADAAVTGVKLENSGVTAGAYGSASAIPVVTVDAKGRVTAMSTAALSGGGVTSLNGQTGAITNTNIDTIGSYGIYISTSTTSVAFNGTIAGSSLRYGFTTNNTGGNLFFNVANYQGASYGGGGTALSGTWRRVNGNATQVTYQNTGTPEWGQSLWVRIS